MRRAMAGTIPPMTFTAQHQPIRSRDARRAGITRAELREGGYRRVRHGIYLPSLSDPGDPDVRIAVAAAALSPRATLGGWAAARIHERTARASADGLSVFDGKVAWPWASAEPEELLVCLPRESRQRDARGIRHFRSDLGDGERWEIDGVPVTSPLRTAFDLARLRGRYGAVIAIDRLAHLGLIDLADLTSLFRRRSRWEGAIRGAMAARLADAGSESPPETVTRLLCVDAGLHGLVANATVRRPDGAFVARVDLLDPLRGLVIEYDGGYHSSAGQRRRDAARQELLEGLGLVVVRVTAVDLATAENRRALAARLRMARARADSAQGRARDWAVDH